MEEISTYFKPLSCLVSIDTSFFFFSPFMCLIHLQTQLICSKLNRRDLIFTITSSNTLRMLGITLFQFSYINIKINKKLVLLGDYISFHPNTVYGCVGAYVGNDDR